MFRMKFRVFKDKLKIFYYKFNVCFIKNKEKNDEFNIVISNKFDVLEGLIVIIIEDYWVKF